MEDIYEVLNRNKAKAINICEGATESNVYTAIERAVKSQKSNNGIVIYNVICESNINGKLMIRTYPCDSNVAMEKQMEIIKDEINYRGRFQGFKDAHDYCEKNNAVINDIKIPYSYFEIKSNDDYIKLYTEVSNLYSISK